MSGGSFNHLYGAIEYEYLERMEDIELNEMMKDLVKVLHDLEWYVDGDICEEKYRETVNTFKKKWFKRTKADVLKLIEKEFEDKKKELLQSLNYLIESKNKD